MRRTAISYTRRAFQPILWGLLAALTVPASEAHAQQDVRIFPDSTAQVIRGFGAANIVGWRPDMADAEIEKAFGVGDGDLGFSLLRLRISPHESQWAANLHTAQKAHAMGVDVVASPWSPPAHMKTNDDLVGGRLRDDMYDDYAEHLDAFVTYMADNGVPLYAVSVQNEPDIQVSYESCDWTPEEMRRFMAEHASSIGTRVMAPESFQFRRAMSDPLLRDEAALANLDIVAGHIYGGGLSPYPLAEEKGRELWMTEHLDTDTDPEAVIGTAVEMQQVMQAGMSAYIWWYIVRFYGPISDGEQGGYARGEVTKRGYVMSQFARFVRPGFVRVHTDWTRLNADVSTTAYRDSSRLVVVAVNDGDASREVRFTVEGETSGSFRRYATSATQDAERLDDVDVSENRFAATLGANSVTTFVSNDVDAAGEGVAALPAAYQLEQNHPNPFRSATTIGYSVPQAGDVALDVFDLLGRRVAMLVDGRVAAGRHQVTFDAARLPPGVYLYRLSAGDVVQTRRMVLVGGSY